MEFDQPSFDHSSFSTNRARLLKHEIAGEFFRAIIRQARALGCSRMSISRWTAR
jgi:hypothetical protein